MAAKFLAGKPVADQVLEQVSLRVRELSGQGVVPGLGTILVGDDGPSASYVNKKHQTCAEVGIRSIHRDIPADAGQDDLLAVVDEFNASEEVDAYLIQHPLPDGFDFNEALGRMDPAKDADGLHPVNLGKLVLQQPGPVPCTPAGIVALLEHYEIATSGKNVCVIGRGPTLGRPLGLLLSQRGTDAAVTAVHSRVENISDYTLAADIVVGAVGVPSIVTPEMVKPGAVVISGGITWEGKKLLPDVDETVGDVAGWITPRLGGVGPTTVAMLLANTVAAAELRARS